MSLIERNNTVTNWLAAHPKKVRPCRYCGERIFFARFASGATAPFDVEPGRGEHFVDVDHDRLIVRRLQPREVQVHIGNAAVTHTIHECGRTMS